MNKELHNIVFEINDTCKCYCCGGRVAGSKCTYCKTEISQEKKDKLEELTKKLHEVVLSLGNMVHSYQGDTLHELFQLSDQNIPFVNQIIEDVQYSDILREALSSVLYEKPNSTGSITSLEKLNDVGYNIYNMLLHFSTDRDISRIPFLKNVSAEEIEVLKNRSALIAFRELYNGKYKTDNTDALKTLYNSIVLFYGKNSGMYVSSRFTDLEVNGQTCRTRVALSNDLLDNSPEQILNTSFHELIHCSQYDAIYNKKILSKQALIDIKDTFLITELGKSFKTENYNKYYTLLPSEQEAYIYSSSFVFDFLKKIMVEPSSKFVEEAKEEVEWASRFVGNSNRFYNGSLVNQDDLFAQKAMHKPELLSEYPQLGFEYINDEGILRRKTLSEVRDDYEKYKNGEITWNGDSNEISSMYEEKIAILKESSPTTY